jgi:hypothetical protein
MRFYLGALLITAGCLRATEYHCSSSDQCGTGGTCEASGYCSFADSSCGQRYGAEAGPFANQCVGTSGGLDAGADGTSATGDAANHCPTTFATLAGGTPGHRYRALAASNNWQLQVNACLAESTFAYLAIPDDATELAALDTLAGASPSYWVGIDDLTTEGTFLTVKNMPATFLPWDPPAPDDAGPGEDCVEALTTLAKFNDQRCNMQLPAICECE